MDLHVFPIPIPPPASLTIQSLWVFPVHQPWALVSYIQPGLVICFTLDGILVSFGHISNPTKFGLFLWREGLLTTHRQSVFCALCLFLSFSLIVYMFVHVCVCAFLFRYIHPHTHMWREMERWFYISRYLSFCSPIIIKIHMKIYYTYVYRDLLYLLLYIFDHTQTPTS